MVGAELVFVGGAGPASVEGTGGADVLAVGFAVEALGAAVGGPVGALGDVVATGLLAIGFNVGAHGAAVVVVLSGPLSVVSLDA